MLCEKNKKRPICQTKVFPHPMLTRSVWLEAFKCTQARLYPFLAELHSFVGENGKGTPVIGRFRQSCAYLAVQLAFTLIRTGIVSSAAGWADIKIAVTWWKLS